MKTKTIQKTGIIILFLLILSTFAIAGIPTYTKLSSAGSSWFKDSLGIGTDSPSSQLHMYSGASGITGNGRLIIEDDTDVFINLLSDAGRDQGIRFGDNADNDAGYISYNHSSNNMNFGVNTATRLIIASDGDVGIGNTAPRNSLDVQAKTTSTINTITVSNPTHNNDYIQMGSSTDAGAIRFLDNTSSIKVFITAGGNSFINGGELKIASVSGSGKAVCVKSDGNLGTCTDAVSASGVCTCA